MLDFFRWLLGKPPKDPTLPPMVRRTRRVHPPAAPLPHPPAARPPADEPPRKNPLPEDPVGPLARSPELETAPDTPQKGWIGVDLDGTLAQFDRWRGLEHIGPPIVPMVLRIQNWLEHGFEVRIVTARASVEGGVAPVREWLQRYGLPDLPVTCQKDFGMIELWDDRAIQVVPNKGSPVLSARYDAHPRAPLFGLEKRQAEADAMEKKFAAMPAAGQRSDPTSSEH